MVLSEIDTKNILPKPQCNEAQPSFQTVKAQTDIYQYYDRNETKLGSKYRKRYQWKKFCIRSIIKPQEILKTLLRDATSAMFQNKKLKRPGTSAICIRKAEFF